MKNKLIITVIGLTLSIAGYALDLEEGKNSYDTDCTKCHDSSVFTREDRKINDLDALKKQVHACVGASGASWFDEDEENVVAYLNKNFYNFAKQQESK